MQTSKLRAIAAVAIALLTCAAVLAPGAADAKKRKRTTVTIEVNGGDFSGRVKHRKQLCEVEREVIVFLQAGDAPDPNTDTQIASDTTNEDGQWNTGNTGANDGRYYAHAPATPGCKAGTSKTVRVTGRPPEPE
jgi:hypothetical protein